MIDTQTLKDDWGYGPLMGASTTGGKASIQPTGQQQPVGGGGTTGTGGTMANFQFPNQWNQAGNVWSQMASGNYTNPGMTWLNNTMQNGGNAFDVSGWDQSYRPAMMDQFSNMTKQMAEQAGVGGTRYGSGLQNSIANYGGQLQNQYTKDLWDRMFGAYEAGQNRAMNAGSLSSQLGFGASQAGAEGLRNLGWDYSNLPMQVANSMFSGGQYLTGQQIDPWTQMMANIIGPTGDAVPQTYTPSWFQNFLTTIGQTWPGGGGGNSAPNSGWNWK